MESSKMQDGLYHLRNSGGQGLNIIKFAEQKKNEKLIKVTLFIVSARFSIVR